MIILGIETSCDETAVSIIKAEGDLQNLSFEVLGSSLHSQIEMHKEFGGVVPNIAKREHQKNLPLVLIDALKKAGLIEANLPTNEIENLKIKANSIDMIVVTVGPGLEPALWVGILFAKELGKKWNIPVIGTNHMEGHIVSVLLTEVHQTKTVSQESKIKFPALALLISGGHTEIIKVDSWKNMEKVGETKDDAVGEAYDKVARMLGLPYPGGPEISKLAEEARFKNVQSKKKLPRPMIHSKDLNFSFSGLKTSVLYYLRDLKKEKEDFQISDEIKLEIAREFEDAIIETLISKTKLAIETYNPAALIIGGGVIANKALRENFLKLKDDYPQLNILIPEKSLTTDNATMIAGAGYIEYLCGNNRELKANGNLNI